MIKQRKILKTALPIFALILLFFSYSAFFFNDTAGYQAYCLAFFSGTGMMLWHGFSGNLRFQLAVSAEKRWLIRQAAIQRFYYLELTDKIEEMIRIRHEERRRLQTLYSVYETRDCDRLGKYLSDYVLTSMPKTAALLYKNPVLGSILHYYEILCRQNGIRFTCSAVLPDRLSISDADLSLLSGSFLENAFEAAIHKDNKTPFISFQATADQNNFFLLVQNSFAVSARKKHIRFFSAGCHSYGIKTWSACAVAKNYGGTCVFEKTDGIFTVSVLLPLKKSDSPDNFAR